MADITTTSVPETAKTAVRQLGPQQEPSSSLPFTVFTDGEKWIIVVLAAFGSLLSPLTANIYFPAIPVMAEQFQKSTEEINLTVTVYMVVQGIAPMLWGTLADSLGRRPIFITCSIVLSLSSVGLALCPTDGYWLLMLLRCVQAAGSASTVALAAGVLGDIVTRAERGRYVGILMLGTSAGPTFGPVIGGGLSQGLGWRSIFWFICISSAFCGVLFLLLLPETLRAIVGNGSIIPSPIYRPLIPFIPQYHRTSARISATTSRPPRQKRINPLRILVLPDIFISLLIVGFATVQLYGILASLSTLFSEVYPYLNQTDIGLCFLSIGGGQAIGSVACGKLIDGEYKRFRARWVDQTRANQDGTGSTIVDAGFPIERARLRLLPPFIICYVACTIGYGWCLHGGVHISVSLVLLFFMGICYSGIFNIIQTLTVDVFPNQGSSITACSNIVRSSMSAAMVAVFDIILRSIGLGWTYVLFGGIGALSLPMTFAMIVWGPRWREQRTRASPS